MNYLKLETEPQQIIKRKQCKATNMETELPTGHTIFRNQPSYRMFNKSFEHVDDTLFAFLNELEPEILKEEQHKPSKIFAEYNCIFGRKDPRTQEVVERAVYDHTNQQLLPYTYPNSQQRYSLLGRSQQAACLRVLLAWQRNSNVDAADFVVYNAVMGKWCKEQPQVQKYFSDYATGQKHRIYAPMKPLVCNYSKWFELRMQYLLRQLPNSSFTTYTGLPQLEQCKGLNVNVASMEQIQLLFRKGQVRHWPEVQLHQQQLSTLRIRLERYIRASVTNETASQSVASELQRQFLNVDEDVFVLPLDAMLLLLLPGAYIDLPTEMMLHIREMPDSDHKCFEFEEPLPARKCGWHTNSRLLALTYAAYAPTKWLQFTSNGVEKLHIVAADNPEQWLPEYKLQPMDEQMQPIGQAGSNSALISWRLQAGSEDPALLVYSSLAIAAVRDALGQHPLGCHLIKLESKPDCGCEIMTKYELISAWLQLKLLQTDEGHCSRISLREFAPLLEQPLTLTAVEEQLKELYHISMPQQLSQLHEFLKLLRNIGSGEYLLRYTTKYPDKFLLCRPTVEAVPQNFQLHDLLMEKLPTDVDFLTQSNNYLPISPMLCSRMHEQFQLLPCAFPAKEKGMRGSMSKPKPEWKPTLVQRTIKKNQKHKKRKSTATRQRKRAAANKKKEEDQSINNFMTL